MNEKNKPMDITTAFKLIRTQFSRLNLSSPAGLFILAQNKRYIGTLLPDHAVILEAGAHKGTDTARMAKMWPDAHIYAFEPVPAIYKILKQNTAPYPNVHTFQIALSDANGFSKMFVSEGTSDASSSLLKPKEHLTIHPTVLFGKQIRVKTMTLDSWAKLNNIPRIDFMWLDMQGMEFRVLKKSSKILHTVKLIYTEVNLKESYAGARLYPEFKSWLISKGFLPDRENIYWNDMGNSLFIRASI